MRREGRTDPRGPATGECYTSNQLAHLALRPAGNMAAVLTVDTDAHVLA